MKKNVLLAISLLIFFNSWSQDENVFKRIHGTVVRDDIFIRPASKSFEYKIDSETKWRPITKGKIYNASNNHDNTIGIHIQFYNPLKYNFKSTFKDQDDFVNLAISQFLSSFPDMEGITAPNTPAASIAQKQNAAYNVANLTESEKSKLKTANETIVLYAWLYEFIEIVDFATIKSDPNKLALFNTVIAELNNETKSIDDYLFRPKITITFDNGPKDKGFDNWLADEKKSLFDCPSDFKKFGKAMENANTVSEGITSAKTRAETGIKKLQTLLSTDFDSKISPLIVSAKIENFKKYSSSASIMLLLNTSSKMTTYESTFDKYTKLLKSLAEFIKDFTTDVEGYRLENQPSFDRKTVTVRNFTLEVKELDIDGNDVADKNFSVDFTVARDEKIIPFVSSGIFYTGFSYPNYAVEENGGTNKVAETPPTQVRVRPAVFLNMMIRSKSTWFYPFIQLGISTGVNDFLVPLGAGVAISNNFSLSAGGIFGLRKELTKLQVGGDVKDDAALKNDLSNKGFVSWYFSINYNFIKKKE